MHRPIRLAAGVAALLIAGCGGDTESTPATAAPEPGSSRTTANPVQIQLADETDYRFACDIVRRYDLVSRCPVHFSPVHGAVDLQALAGWILRDRLGVRLQLQLHKFIWHPQQRGV